MKGEILTDSYNSPFQQLELWKKPVIYCEPCNKISWELAFLENSTQNALLFSKWPQTRFPMYCENCDKTMSLKKREKVLSKWIPKLNCLWS